MSFRLKSRLVRLERAEAKVAAHKSFKLRLGDLKRLPRDYTGERHVEIVRQLPSRSPIGKWFEFEERPGPAPPEPPSEERIIEVHFVGPGDGG
jgi:hypothetical protein